MTHCAPEAKSACLCAITGLVRGLRSRLKALRRLLLLAGTDGGRRRPTADAGRSERPGLLTRKNGGPVLGCCGPALPSMSVSRVCVTTRCADSLNLKQSVYHWGGEYISRVGSVMATNICGVAVEAVWIFDGRPGPSECGRW